jgi:hypothetical protein
MFVGEDDGLDAVAQAKFHQHACDVGLDRGVADDQLGRDLLIRRSVRTSSSRAVSSSNSRGCGRVVPRRPNASITRRVTTGHRPSPAP